MPKLRSLLRSLPIVAAAVAVAGLPALPTPTAVAAPVGWEKEFAGGSTGWNRTSSPTIADVDGDGVNDVLVGHQDGHVTAYRADGSELWRAPIVPFRADGPVAVDSSPTVADIDNDGSKEVIVGAGSLWVENQQGGLVVLNSNGSLRWQWGGNRDFGNVWAESPANDGFVEPVYSTPAVGDVDGDGYPDIVFGGWDQYIHALDRNGNELPGFPFPADDTVWSSPALHDVDRDGRQEIFIGADSTAGSSVDVDGGVFFSLEWENGGVNLRWRHLLQESVMSSPSIGDINGDGRLEAVTGTGLFWSQGKGPGDPHWEDSRRIFAFHLDDGSYVPGWPQPTPGGWVKSQPALGDVDGNGSLDVVVGTNEGWVFALRGDGSRIWAQRHDDFQVLGSAVIADLDGSGTQEVAISSGLTTYILEGANGGEEDRVNFLWSSEATPAFGYFGAAGWRLIVTGFHTANHTTRLASYGFPAPTAVDWSQWRKNARHTATGATLDPIPRNTAEACPPGRVTPQNRFPDVPSGNGHRANIDCVAWWGIAQGSNGQYLPSNPVNRAQMASFIARLIERATGDELPEGDDAFGDDEGQEFAAHEPNINKLANAGIVSGKRPGVYAPGELVTREQMATFLVRAYNFARGTALPATLDWFTDDDGSTHEANINIAATAGFTGGSGGGYRPRQAVARDQMASFLARVLDLLVEEGAAELP